MAKAFISVASNIDPAKNIKEALRLLSARTPIEKISTVYHTEPELRPEQSWYYNCVVAIDTDLRPEEIKYNLLRRIENKLGRKRSADKFAARPIDLDLILYEGVTAENPELPLPDPEIFERPYLLAALRELSPELELKEPKTARFSTDTILPEMEILESYTKLLRSEVFYGARH
jgi:2-amino-4-hydroxy-6-hydroxymethyldihydropteridine diphosphokinase